jgi:hypothetical protein
MDRNATERRSDSSLKLCFAFRFVKFSKKWFRFVISLINCTSQARSYFYYCLCKQCIWCLVPTSALDTKFWETAARNMCDASLSRTLLQVGSNKLRIDLFSIRHFSPFRYSILFSVSFATVLVITVFAVYNCVIQRQCVLLIKFSL